LHYATARPLFIGDFFVELYLLRPGFGVVERNVDLAT
jgi:hypothetical protein